MGSHGKLRNNTAKPEKLACFQRNRRVLLCKVTNFLNPKLSRISSRNSFLAMEYTFFYKANIFKQSMCSKYALFTPTYFDIRTP